MSSTAAATTDACTPQPPRFGEVTYAFEISAGASAGDPVGVVLAIDVNGDTVTYSITAGNEAGKFGIDASTGEITLAASLGAAAGTTYTLTVDVLIPAHPVTNIPLAFRSGNETDAQMFVTNEDRCPVPVASYHLLDSSAYTWSGHL